MTVPGSSARDEPQSPASRDREAAGHAAHDVFVSYSTSDKPVADAIVARLEQAGIRCWVAPRDIIPGQVWGEAILRAIEGARLMVVVISGAANESRQVIREVERAVANNVVVVPFRIESIEPTGAMAYFLASEHWLDAMTPPLDAHIVQLMGVARALLDSISPAPPRTPAAAVGHMPRVVQPAPAAPPRARRWPLIAGIVGAGLLVALGVIGALALAPSSSPATPSTSPLAPRVVAESALVTGDCLLTPPQYTDSAADQARFWAEQQWSTSWAVVECDQPHGAEVFFYGDVWGPEATYPGDATVSARWDTHCAAEFERYVGIAPGRSTLAMVGWTGFGADGWAQGLRDMACIAYDRGGADLLGSIRGAAR